MTLGMGVGLSLFITGILCILIALLFIVINIGLSYLISGWANFKETIGVNIGSLIVMAFGFFMCFIGGMIILAYPPTLIV